MGDPSSSPLPEGHVVASRYTLEEVMGRGQFGWVYRATDPQLEAPVVLYVLAEGVAGPGGPLEFKLWLAAIHRRGGQDILDYTTVDGLTFVTLRYVPGKGIAREIAESIAFHEARRTAQARDGAAEGEGDPDET
jgi:serine/threonine protein kinase